MLSNAEARRDDRLIGEQRRVAGEARRGGMTGSDREHGKDRKSRKTVEILSKAGGRTDRKT